MSTLGAKDTCTEAKCKLLVDGNDFTAEFQSKSSEDGVRMVYLHLNVGNGSYNPLESHDRFLPNRWTWARGVDEPMLYFSYQYQVLSLGLLKNQVRNIELTLSVEPPGCVANVTYSCKDIMVATTLLEKITDALTDPSLSEDVVCVSVVERDINWVAAWFEGNIQFHCCKQERSGNETVVRCDLPVQNSRWYMLFYHVLTLGIIVLFFFWPAVIPWLQKQNDDAKSDNNEIIPIDDFSPITCLTLWHKYQLKYCNPRVRQKTGIVEKMISSYYIYMLFYAYIFLALTYAFYLKYLTEVEAKNAIPENALFYYVFDIRSSKLYCLIPVIIFFIILPANFFFFIAYASEEFQHDFSRQMIDNLSVFRERQLNFLFEAVRQHDERSDGSDKWVTIVSAASNFIVKYLKKKSSGSRKMVFLILFSFLATSYVILRVLLAVLVLVSFIAMWFFCLLVFILFLVIDVIRFSPFTTLIKFIFKFMVENLTKTSLYLCLPVFLAWMIYFSLAVTVCCGFYIRMFGFVLVGLIINAQKTTPYVAFLLVFISNIYTSYNTLRKRFKEMKKIIFKYYKKRTDSSSKTIPEKLFWYICKDVLPIKSEIFAMLTNMLIISSISLLALAIIVFFGEVFNSSTLVQAGAVLLSGKLTGTLFNGLIKSEKFTGLDKIEKSKEIKELVEEWINWRVNEATTLDIED